MGWRVLADWKSLAVFGQVLAVGLCVAIGARVLARPAATPVRVARPAAAPGLGPVRVKLTLPSRPTAGGGVRAVVPALSAIASRANRDDLLLYREQTQVIEMMASATRQYLERHVLPLLLAAARGGVG